MLYRTWLRTGKNHCLLIVWSLGNFWQKHVYMHHSLHNMLRLFTHRKAYDINGLSIGGWELLRGNPIADNKWLIQSSQALDRIAFGSS